MRKPTHTLYAGRNVKTYSHRAQKIAIWESKEDEKRRGRAIKRDTGARFAV